MPEKPFNTRITRLFDIRHPVLAGGLMWLSDAPYVAAVVNAGGMGFITSRSSDSLEKFEAQLAHCAALTGGKAFGVNLSTSRHAAVPLMAYLDAALAAGVRHFETAGRAPADDLIRRIHDAGTEVSAHPNYKSRMVEAGEDDHTVCFAANTPLGGAWRVLNNATAREVRAREAAGLTEHADFAELTRGTLQKDAAYGQGDIEAGMLSMGPAVAFIDQVEPIAAIMERLMEEATSSLHRLETLTRS